jgi:hypothetical protein
MLEPNKPVWTKLVVDLIPAVIQQRRTTNMTYTKPNIVNTQPATNMIEFTDNNKPDRTKVDSLTQINNASPAAYQADE